MKRIPNRKLPNEYYSYNFIYSPLVPISNDSGIVIDMKYPLMGLKHSIKECLVRKEVLDKLLEAKKYLPRGITFKIWDAYRPFSLQKELYYKYKDMIIEEYNLKKLSKEEKNKIISKYVSLPIKSDTFMPLHTTGGSVDLTLVYIKNGQELDLGTEFDSFTELTQTNSYEKRGMNKVIRNNRRILYNAMTKAGFTNLPSEWWHYDYGNRSWAYYNKKPAIYNGIY